MKRLEDNFENNKIFDANFLVLKTLLRRLNVDFEPKNISSFVSN